jgi:hypothetical protein
MAYAHNSLRKKLNLGGSKGQLDAISCLGFSVWHWNRFAVTAKQVTMYFEIQTNEASRD